MRAREFINLDIKNEGVIGGGALGAVAGGLIGGGFGAVIGAWIGAAIGLQLENIKKIEQAIQNLQTTTSLDLDVEIEKVKKNVKNKFKKFEIINDTISKNMKEIIEIISKIPDPTIRQKYLDKFDKLSDWWSETDLDSEFELYWDNKFYSPTGLATGAGMTELDWYKKHDLKYLNALSKILLEIKQIPGIK